MYAGDQPVQVNPIRVHRRTATNAQKSEPVALPIALPKFFWWLIAAAAVVALLRVVWVWDARMFDRALAERRRLRKLAARAGQQHAWIMAGDSRGTYGNWPPQR